MDDRAKDPAAVALGRRGGLKGGRARVAKMTKAQLSRWGTDAANARWHSPEGQVRRAVRELIRNGYVERVGKDLYQLRLEVALNKLICDDGREIPELVGLL